MTLRAGVVQPLGIHMNVELLVGVEEGGIKIPVLDPVGAAAVEVTTATVDPAGSPDMLGDFFQVDRLEELTATLLVRQRRIAAGSGKLAVSSGGVVAGQAIDILGLMEIELTILPTVTGVTAGAPAPVGDRRDSVVVQDMGLAEHLPALLIRRLPGPVQ